MLTFFFLVSIIYFGEKINRFKENIMNQIEVIEISTQKKFMKNKVYLCVNNFTNETVLIDPSWEMEKIENVINDRKLDLKAILLTHSHFDHVNLVDDFVDKYDCEVYISKIEKEFYSFDSKNLITFSDGEELNIGSIKINTVIMPGHSKGSACFIIEKNFFSGDTLWIEKCALPCELYKESSSDLLKSIRYIFDNVNDDFYFYPGHAFREAPGILFSKVKEKNKFTNVKSINDFESMINWSSFLQK